MDKLEARKTWAIAATDMLNRAKVLGKRPLCFRAGDQVLKTFGADFSVCKSYINDYPIYPMQAEGLALITY